MKTLKELQNELVQLQTALAKKLVTPTEYGSITQKLIAGFFKYRLKT